ncbi:hypothetical protein [Bowmanella sp. JS7-9]|uniref:Sulfotransferase family protein n=1 Tax=Pseudobowmanella zhangzhouensis TaxID=1537679 RepID=A0ABW1XER8_9ALTE|nr:hypothetical protein [Bowmanella sp. JS7-9]TBX20842.1 hypothetical protein TK45_13775 [Bowmanella sp. JS7-9]
MKKNVIILTHGWTGSSAFTALISQGQYWLGDETFQKIDYNTYENSELVALNNKMIADAGYTGDREHEILTEQAVLDVTQKIAMLDPSPYKAFAEKLSENQPWIWKDPRLALTIRAWMRFVDIDSVEFIILTRDDMQSWITSNQRRHIQSLSFTRRYNKSVTDSFKRFLTERGKSYSEFEFEDLQLRPEQTIERLNQQLGLKLTMEDLHRVYNKPLYKKSKRFKDWFEALAVYVKNYALRDGRGRA